MALTKKKSDALLLSSLSFRQGTDDIGISGIGDRQGAHTEVLSASGSQLDVVTVVVVDSGLGQHSVVFDLGLPIRVMDSKVHINKSVLTSSYLRKPFPSDGQPPVATLEPYTESPVCPQRETTP